MRILTVRQPWADLIIHGGKDVENRAQRLGRGIPGPIAIHAGKTVADITPADEAMIRANATEAALESFDAWWDGEDVVGGAIIGVVDLVEVHAAFECLTWQGHVDLDGDWQPCSPWAERTGHHMVLANPRALHQPIPYTGALGLRRLDEDMTARILAAIA